MTHVTYDVMVGVTRRRVVSELSDVITLADQWTRAAAADHCIVTAGDSAAVVNGVKFKSNCGQNGTF